MMDYLPVELLLRIARYLHHPHCLSLVLTCRRIYHAALPAMYSEVYGRRSFTTAKSLSCFLHTIARKPHLAKSVKILGIDSWDTCDDRAASLDSSNKPCYDEELIGNLVREASGPEEEEEVEMSQWEMSLRNGNPDAWMALLMPLLINLRELHIEYTYSPDYFNKMLIRAAKKEKDKVTSQKLVKAAKKEKELVVPFQKLEEVYVTWADTELGVSSCDLLPYFYFPSMRKLHGESVVERLAIPNHELLDGDEASEGFSSIEEIHLDCSNSSDGMEDWLRCCKALKSFSIEHGGAMVSEESWNSPPFAESLTRHKSTLEFLWLDISDHNDIDEEQWIGSLADYTALRDLHIRYPDLVGMNEEDWEPLHEISDLVPPSLRTLSIAGCGEDILHWLPGQLERLIESRRTPHLVNLDLDGFSIISREGCEPELVRLYDLCEGAGVRLR
ncbi:hypothetical protein BDW59DRAFT_143327 [Aspergillus cavernicola]|uniref:F-box domain-containing protein n=1 Tax=Aspergillus cavernicola TaxID=176166 RepID=A0ABR4IK92_9EURO